MRNGKLLLTGVILLAAVGWGVSQLYGSDEGGLPPLNIETVGQGSVRQQIIAHGTLQPVQKVTVSSQVSGNIEQIMVDFNSRVERGQVIAQIDPSGFEAEVSSAEAELESAEAALELAQYQWQRIQQLRERQFVSPSDVDEARASLRQAEAQVSVRRHALDRARLELNRSTIYSPTDGIVISRNVDVGQTVAASLSAPDLFEIATDLRQMHIYANVSEADIGQVRDGQQVLFQVDGYRDRTFNGEVIQVRNAPIIEDNVVHYETIVLVDNGELLLKPGMTAEVTIITDERDDVLRLRNNALRARLPDQLLPEGHDDEIEEGHQRVYLIQNGELVAGSASTGLSDGVYTEILEIFQQLNQRGLTILMVTHEPEIARFAQRVITLRDRHLCRLARPLLDGGDDHCRQCFSGRRPLFRILSRLEGVTAGSDRRSPYRVTTGSSLVPFLQRIGLCPTFHMMDLDTNVQLRDPEV